MKTPASSEIPTDTPVALIVHILPRGIDMSSVVRVPTLATNPAGETVETTVEVEVDERVLRLIQYGDRRSGRSVPDITFTDLVASRARSGDDSPAVDVDNTPEPTGARWKGRGIIPRAGQWAGQRSTYYRLLGLSRPGWTSAPFRDARGRCGDCGGLARLPRGTYCLSCDRAGAELEVPAIVTRPAVRRPVAPITPVADPVAPLLEVLMGGLGSKPRKPNGKQRRAMSSRR